MNTILETEAIQIIKEEIESRGLTALKIILFGSRARGDFKEDSDWDIFVIIKEDITFKQKREILSNIYKKLAKKGNKSFEIVLTSEGKFKSAREYVGTLSYEVDKEGILIWG
jgi:predicted nucleotidyltransferase